LSGMLSQVFRPITTAFVVPSGAAEVTCAKYDISFGSRHGRLPFLPIPFERVAATMMVRRDIMVDRKSENRLEDADGI